MRVKEVVMLRLGGSIPGMQFVAMNLDADGSPLSVSADLGLLTRVS
jgi:hypothetical protein